MSAQRIRISTETGIMHEGGCLTDVLVLNQSGFFFLPVFFINMVGDELFVV